MRHPLAHTFLAIKALEEQPLIILHPAPVVEPLTLVEPHARRLARPVRVPVLDANQVLIVHAIRGSKSQWRCLHGSVQRPPDIDDSVSTLE